MKTAIYTRNEVGDHVKCCNCETVMLVDIGTDTCPKCGTVGTLAWVDQNNPERNAYEIASSNDTGGTTMEKTIQEIADALIEIGLEKSGGGSWDFDSFTVAHVAGITEAKAPALMDEVAEAMGQHEAVCQVEALHCEEPEEHFIDITFYLKYLKNPDPDGWPADSEMVIVTFQTVQNLSLTGKPKGDCYTRILVEFGFENADFLYERGPLSLLDYPTLEDFTELLHMEEINERILDALEQGAWLVFKDGNDILKYPDAVKAAQAAQQTVQA